MRRLIFLAVLLAGFACSSDPRNEMRSYFRKQMERRIAYLRDQGSRDTVVAREVMYEVERVILISKDVENPQAALNLHHDLFNRWCESYNFNRSDFPDPLPMSSPDEIELQMRENALAFIDRIVMSDTTAIYLFTAH